MTFSAQAKEITTTETNSNKCSIWLVDQLQWYNIHQKYGNMQVSLQGKSYVSRWLGKPPKQFSVNIITLCPASSAHGKLSNAKLQCKNTRYLTEYEHVYQQFASARLYTPYIL